MTRFALRCTVALLAGLIAWPLRAAELPPKLDTPGGVRFNVVGSTLTPPR